MCIRDSGSISATPLDSGSLVDSDSLLASQYMNRNTLPLTLIARSPHGKCSVASGLAMACSRSRASAASRPAPDDGPRFDGFAAAFFAAVFGGFAAVFGGFAVVF